MQGTYKAPSCEPAWEDIGNLVVGVHPALEDLLLGLNTAIEAIAELEKLRHREAGSVVDKAIGYGKVLRIMRDGLQRAMPAEVVDMEALWEISLGSTPRNGMVEA